ncbi:MAG: LysM peptidoglycan-binding domain-containing protein [Chloroflexi bacterium]|nr:LysM peptidoglycan-binding domain-containing protein [Chloroflexota bacterium]
MSEAYAQAYFERLDAQGKVVKRLNIQFNPAELSMEKAAQIAEIAIPGIDSPILQFIRGQNEKVTLELFFDTTEQGTGPGAAPVTTRTNEFYALVKMSGREHAPPRCRFGWGAEFPGLVHQAGEVIGARKAFDCVVESIRQKFTLFSPEGVPLRATLAVSLREYKSLETQLQQLNLQSADHTRVHIVQRGETLPQIAYIAYQDPAKWRLIAQANGLLRPRELQPGMVLELPPERT